MFEDFGQYNLDRLNTKEIKSQDVLRKHSLDPNLEDDPILKANTILISGDELQKFSVLLSFPDLFRRNSAECFKVLVPKMQQSLPGASVDYHMLASSAVRTLLQDRIISPDMFVSNFLHTILTAMDSKDLTVSTTWSETLYDVLDYLPTKVLQIDILPVIIGKLDVTVPIPTRIISCKILKQLIKHCDASVLRRDLVPLVVALCQDVSSDVRSAGCGPLAALALAAGPDVLKSHLMNALVDVASDDSPGVRQAAFPTVISVCPLMPIEMLRNTGIPLVVKFVKLAFRNNENLTSTISENFGTMCLSLERGLALNDKEEYFIWYQSLTSLGNPQCQINKKGIGIFFDHKVSFDKLVDIREYGANNFMLMTKFTKGDIERKFSSLLAECFRCMISDPSSCIRKKTASIFSEVLTFYNKNGVFLKQELNILLTDSSDEVLEAIVPQISQLVDEFVKLGIYKVAKDMFVLEFVSSLMKCESTLSMSHRWRSYVCLLSQMEILCRGFNTEAIAANFLPLLWKRLTSIRNLQNRKAVFRFVIVILRMSKKEQTRNEIINRIINELCMSNSFYNRMLFMRCCPFLNEIFSTKFIKQNFLVNILLMAEDPVANVRWAFVTYIPYIKGMLTSEDKLILDQLNLIIEKLTYDSDAEVRRQLNSISPQLASLEKDKMYPDDKKKYDMEMMLFSGRRVEPGNQPVGSSVVSPSGGVRHSNRSVPESQRTRQFNNNPHARSPNPSITSKSSSQHRQDSEVASLNSHTSTGCVSELNEKEFLIDAGVKLPVNIKGNNTYIRPSRSGIATLNSGATPVRRPNPGSRACAKRHSTPPSSLSSTSLDNKPTIKNKSDNNNNNNINKEASTNSDKTNTETDKVSNTSNVNNQDVNNADSETSKGMVVEKNNFAGKNENKGGGISNGNDVRRRQGVVRRCNPSHLPRPLSLYNLPSNNHLRQQQQNHNLPTKNSTTSLASRLPVYRLSDKSAKR